MIQIRPATADDRPSIAAVHVASIRGLAKSHYNQVQIDAWCEGKVPELYALDESQIFVAVDGDEVVGFGELLASEGEVKRVYVSPKVARTGVGLMLLIAVENAALMHGLEKLRLDASLNAVEFYKKHGYKETGRGAMTRESGKSAPYVLMEKNLMLAEPAVVLTRAAVAADAPGIAKIRGLSVREVMEEDALSIVKYWADATDDDLKRMGEPSVSNRVRQFEWF